MPIRFSSEQEARDYSQSVPVLRLSTMRVSISPHARKHKRLFFAPVYYIDIQFETSQETVVIGGYEFYDCALTMLDTDPDHVLIGDNGPDGRWFPRCVCRRNQRCISCPRRLFSFNQRRL